MTELYLKHRPKSLKAIRGQDSAVKMVSAMLAKRDTPHAMLFVGPSGCGKTTIARVLSNRLGIGVTNPYKNLKEINCAENRGLDMIRYLDEDMRFTPIKEPCKVYILDECHQLTRRKGGDAQTALLKILEDYPKHVYFFLCTTHPHDLLPTIRTRCTKIKLGAFKDEDLEKLLKDVAEKEGITLTESVMLRILETAEGSARESLVLLHQIKDLENEKEQLDAIVATDTRTAGIDLARLLMKEKKQWSSVAKLIDNLGDDVETIRRIVLGYANTVLLSGGRGSHNAAVIIHHFRNNFFDSGKAGLTFAAYSVCQVAR